MMDDFDITIDHENVMMVAGGTMITIDVSGLDGMTPAKKRKELKKRRTEALARYDRTNPDISVQVAHAESHPSPKL